MMCSRGFIYVIVNIFAIILIGHCEDENYFEDIMSSEETIDPHSFYYDKQNKKMIKETNLGPSKTALETYHKIENECKYAKDDNFNVHEAIFYKRLINLLLSNINIKAKDDVSIVGILEIEMSHAQMELLQNFHVQKVSLRKVDEILSNIIRKPRYNNMLEITYIFDVLLDKFEAALKIIQQHPDGVIIVSVILITCWIFRTIRWGQRVPMFAIIQVIFIMSFFMTWWQLIQEAEIKSVAEQMKFSNVPISCQPDKMSLWDKFISFITFYDECEKYYQVTMSNPKLKITPAFALSHFMTTVIVHPITVMGTAVSGFIKNATADLPWFYTWTITIILYICVGVFIIVLPFCLSGASCSLGLGPLFRFKVDNQRKDKKGNSLENVTNRDPIQIILQVPQSTNVPAIEDAQISKTSSKTEDNIAERILEKTFKNSQAYEDLSCGDTMTNIAKCDEVNADVIKKNNGSGDN